MPRIRVLQIVTGLAIGEQLGGAELFAVQLARCLDESVFCSAVFGLWKYGSPTERHWVNTLEQEGIHARLLVVPTGCTLSDLGRALSKLWRAVSDFEPQIINSHSERTDAFNILVRTLHPAHPVSVRTMHTDQQWQDSPLLGKALVDLIFPLMFDAEVAISEAVRQRLDGRLVARLTRKRSTLCYNGIDASILEKRTPSDGGPPVPSQVPKSRPRIGVIGRLTEQKGHCDLLKAMRIVLQEQAAHLVVVGSGPLEQNLRKMASDLGIEDFVYFLGSRRDVLEILPHLDLLVSSSLWEGFPTVLLEAMATGVPTVATDVSGSRELVKPGETGMLVPPRKPDALAKGIITMLNEPSGARSMAENARQLVNEFTIQNTASRYSELYKRVASTDL